jgi:uncharacterized membrane protein YfcA
MTVVFDLTVIQVTALAIGFFLGGFVKGGLGFAFPLIIIAIATHFVTLDLVLATVSVLQPCINIFQFANGGNMIATLIRLWPMIVGLAIGAPIGAMLLPIVDRQFLLLGVGLFIIAFVFWLQFRPNIHIPPHAERRVGGIAGIVAGMLGTLTTINGPIFVSYLLGVRVERQEMVSALGLLFFISGIFIAGSFMATGVLNGERFLLSLGCAVPAVLGMWAGNYAGSRVPAELFRKVVLAGLFLLGVNMTVRAAFTL